MALWLCCRQAPPGPGAAAGRWTLPPAAGGGCPGCLALSLAGLSVSRQGCRGGSSQTVACARFLSHRGACLWSTPRCRPPAGLHCGLATSTAACLQASGVQARPPTAVPLPTPPPADPAWPPGRRVGHRLVSDPARPAAPYLLVSRTKKQSALSGRASEHQMSHRVLSAWLCAEASG